MKKYTVGLYEKAMPSSLSWKEKMLTAKELGYDFIEISIDETDDKLSRLDWSLEQRRSFVDLMKETGLPIRSLCLSGHRKYPLGDPDPAIRKRSLEIMQKAVDFADDLGIRIIQLAGYDVYYQEGSSETRAFFLENLKLCTEMAAVRGIYLGFETMETGFMNTVEKAMDYVDQVNSPYLGVYPDCGNLKNASVLYGTDLYQDMELGRGHLLALHLKETVPGVFREVRFLTGHVDFDQVIQKAWDLGIRRYVTEMWYVGQENWKEDIREAYQAMTALLDQQG